MKKHTVAPGTATEIRRALRITKADVKAALAAIRAALR